MFEVTRRKECCCAIIITGGIFLNFLLTLGSLGLCAALFYNQNKLDSEVQQQQGSGTQADFSYSGIIIATVASQLVFWTEVLLSKPSPLTISYNYMMDDVGMIINTLDISNALCLCITGSGLAIVGNIMGQKGEKGNTGNE